MSILYFTIFLSALATILSVFYLGTWFVRKLDTRLARSLAVVLVYTIVFAPLWLLVRKIHSFLLI